MTIQQQARVALPTKAEAKQIIPTIREELTKAGLTDAKVYEAPTGGVKAIAEIAPRMLGLVTNALFGYGIVIVPIRPGEWGFAVRR